MIDVAVLRSLLENGATAEMIVAAVEAAQAVETEKLAARREQNRIRKRNQRERERDRQDVTQCHAPSRVTNVTSPSPSSPKERSPLTLPPKEITPPPSPPREVPAADGGFEPVNEDPKAKLFRLGKTILVSFGVAEKRTGGLIGQWLKVRPDPDGLLAAIQFARDQNVAEPVAYISAVVHSKDKTNGKQSPGEKLRAIAAELRKREHGEGVAEQTDAFGGD